MSTRTPKSERRRMEIGGRVQGVGFRPFVARLAHGLDLTGLVGNDSRGAFIEVQGPASALDQFAARLARELPPLARIARLDERVIDCAADDPFRIVSSQHGSRQDVEITPDAATCADCSHELHDPDDRRWRYPFINCTNCGPRYSIIEGVPYDRPQTTMAPFSLCERCQGEYDDAADRRYHAQPNACARCGPRLWFADAQGKEVEAEDALVACAEQLSTGAIVAIKGLGGFHLACRADDEQAVQRLRARKGREAKPLALMVSSLAQARQLARISPAAEAALFQPARPIVLVPRRPDAPIASGVAPATESLGLMLPYTPLHELLFAGGNPPLVMTSGNASEEPLSWRNEEALCRLGSIADFFLLHDRKIARPIDDSVLMIVDGEHEPPVMLRRARGFVPEAIALGEHSEQPILALGGDLKSTLCLLHHDQAVLSEHLGDLDNPAAFRNFVAARKRLLRLLRAEPARLVCDRHPGYHSRAHAFELGIPVIEVQHHHAHAVSCMAEHGLSGKVVAISADGTGYGDDGAIWGGEVLVCDARGYRRAGQLRYAPLFGGDLAARQSWRPALGHVVEALQESWRDGLPRFEAVVSAQLLEAAVSRLERAPRSSSLGRLFDSVAFLLGTSAENRYEGDAAIGLENVARSHAHDVAPLDFELERAEGPWQIDPRAAIRQLLARQQAGESPSALALAFHRGVALAFAEVATRVAREAGLERVVLSGGCMLNRLLLAQISRRLEAHGLEVYRHERVPPGDGGLALGQAMIGAALGRPA